MFHKRLLHEYKENIPKIIFIVFMQWIGMLANVLFVYKLAIVVGDLFNKKMIGSDIREFLIIGIFTIIIRIITVTIGNKLSFEVSTIVKSSLRERIFEKLLRLGNGYNKNISTAEVVQLSTEGVDQLEIYFGRYVPQFFYSLLAPITLFFIVCTMDIKVAVVLLICVPLIPISIIAVQKFAKKMLNKYWSTYTELGDTFLECLQGLTTLKIYGADEEYAKRMNLESQKFRKVTMRVLIMQLNSISIMDLVAYGGAAIGIILSLISLSKGNIEVYQCFFIIMISAEFFLPLRLLGSFFHIAMNGNAAANKIFKLLDTEEQKDGSVELSNIDNITFENVNFAYEDSADRIVLQDINISIPKGKMTAIVGESGCGKSTIVSLIIGEELQTNGDILINNRKMNEYTRTSRMKKIIRINHNSYIFKGTIKSNLAMGLNNDSHCKNTENKMREVLELVGLTSLIDNEYGLDSEVKERGSNLSGGQCQRLAVARAILSDADVYIFDEATSNVDIESEEKIMEVIRKISNEKAVIVISHRLENIISADNIYVIEKGIVKETGKHEELMAEGVIYRELYNRQKELEAVRNA